ncbi:MAG: hypothetical protein RIQ96_1002, partial [Pseudomonadota bacterium]
AVAEATTPANSMDNNFFILRAQSRKGSLV